jgi:hypothetical protein
MWGAAMRVPDCCYCSAVLALPGQVVIVVIVVIVAAAAEVARVRVLEVASEAISCGTIGQQATRSFHQGREQSASISICRPICIESAEFRISAAELFTAAVGW